MRWKQFLAASGIRIAPCPRQPVPGINAKDKPVVASAIAAGVSHFVTGDARLLAEMRAAKRTPLAQALTPREMLETLSQ